MGNNWLKTESNPVYPSIDKSISIYQKKIEWCTPLSVANISAWSSRNEKTVQVLITIQLFHPLDAFSKVFWQVLVLENLETKSINSSGASQWIDSVYETWNDAMGDAVEQAKSALLYFLNRHSLSATWHRSLWCSDAKLDVWNDHRKLTHDKEQLSFSIVNWKSYQFQIT